MHTYRGAFEVHLTVRVVGSLDAFRAWCAVERCKCVWIRLARGAHLDQPMATWRRADGILPEVLAEARQRVGDLERAGFPVLRLKIEADPANEQVPVTDDAARLEPSVNYFEHHIKLRRPVSANREHLLRVCCGYMAHLSRNAWRIPVEGFEERFVTLRSYGVGRGTSEQLLHRLIHALAEAGEQVIEVESEYAVYDSNLTLDDGWLAQETSSSTRRPPWPE